jgi:excisionase family DNA binding protein
MDKILTVNDVAEILQVKAITVREMFREQRLRAFKIGKAWRTTEVMLQEDIVTMARGESPPPMENATSPQQVPEQMSPVQAPKPKRAKNPKKVAPTDEDTEAGDSQPMLF